MHSISAKILETLNNGKRQLGEDALNHLSAFIQSQLLEDQSFKDKSGKSDMYYTAFGWMLCFVLNIKLNTKKMAEYLSVFNENELDLIHYASFKRCQLLHYLMSKGSLLTWLKTHRKQTIKPLESFRNVPHDDINAPYTQYIWLSLLEDTGNKLNDSENVNRALKVYQLDEGGYMNVKGGSAATTNASAAALSVLGQITNYQFDNSLEFVKKQQHVSGGFLATGSSPVPDLLSTATALFILRCYQQSPNYEAHDFIEAHWSESGGFIATLLDAESDVEYCFYGLLALGAAQSNNSDAKR
ncbi:prenyltransferase/squalene oxidase repeat-containing protein [Carboxylicivirga sp. M1479]|uniref:prenyltransferase/squalene oxidase repeat-containing protein n=1 Tax=Carboxylicivirga sp. M1479 TaxID=2594476 RepID=UPI001178B58E|nr:prenyltransferase/squalene oxidase repeat-containing protein [Carboxylicivirga sp. M1479]TRX70620.1 hypothetical protein FNN09_10120 [Carboxylicivirga sp. M1479]